MSQQDRDTIAQKVNEMAMHDASDPPPPGLAWLVERALCDLNRIADALETMSVAHGVMTPAEVRQAIDGPSTT